MRVRELFEKASLPKHTPFVRTKLSELKASLWGHDLSGLQIKACLNSAFAPLMIKFTLNPTPDKDSEYARVGLDGAEYTPDGWVVVHLTDEIADVLGDNTRAEYEDFVNLCTASISHELKHRDQVLKHEANSDNAKDPERLRDYLSDHRELESFAVQCALELLASWEPKQITAKMGSWAGREELMKYSEVLKLYDSVFHMPSALMARFYKKLHLIIDGLE